MLKIAVIGCGKIADSHLAQIARIDGCEVVGVCDLEVLMARQLAERFEVPGYYDSVEEMLAEARPDVVHITTPPQSHRSLAVMCLEGGSHVYMEKPFALNAAETREVLELAEEKGLKVTAGHDDQFAHVAMELRRKVAEGYLGGPPVFMESYYCYDLADESYAKALLGDRTHWVRSLPGKLLHNIIAHGISRIAEFMEGDDPTVVAHGFTSQTLKNIGEDEIVDELRVVVNDRERTTATFTFSSQMRPVLHSFRIYGKSGGLELDNDHQTLIRLRGPAYKSYLEKFVPPFTMAGQYAACGFRNIFRFLRNDFHMKSGMKYLTEAFYRSIREDAPLPISYREIILTATIMDRIFEQVYPDLQGDNGDKRNREQG
jgi:predicted dehydrogenase